MVDVKLSQEDLKNILGVIHLTFKVGNISIADAAALVSIYTRLQPLLIKEAEVVTPKVPKPKN